MPDAIFDDPRMVELYDPLDAYRGDLDVYEVVVAEFAARSVLDIGCGTGTFACRLALRGLDVVGVDPSGASIEVAGRKAGADRVRSVVGEVADALPLQVDLATMTANVAQVFLTEQHWRATRSLVATGLVLDEVRGAPDRPGAEMVFFAHRRW